MKLERGQEDFMRNVVGSMRDAANRIKSGLADDGDAAHLTYLADTVAHYFLYGNVLALDDEDTYVAVRYADRANFLEETRDLDENPRTTKTTW
jgi:hypothetical protein